MCLIISLLNQLQNSSARKIVLLDHVESAPALLVRPPALMASRRVFFHGFANRRPSAHPSYTLKARGEEFSGEATLEITCVKATLLPPGNISSVATGEITYVRVWCPERPRLEWLLIINLPLKAIIIFNQKGFIT